MAPEKLPRIEKADPLAMGAWDDYVRSRPDASVYHLGAWRELIESAFGRETYYLQAASGETLCGVLPLVRLRSIVFGDFLVSLPYVSYGGVLANDTATATCLIDEAVSLSRSLGVRHMELRHLSDLVDLPQRTEKVSMRLALFGDSEKRWKALGSKLRAQINRPLREGTTHEIGGAELVEDFYGVFALKYRDLGVPVYSIDWFRLILARLPDTTRVFVVRIGGRPVAASIVIGFNEILEVPWAASLRAADAYGVNMYLYWTMIKFAEDAGYKAFDFGRSTIGSGTWRFKKQWGAEPVQMYWHYWVRDRSGTPQLNTANPKYRAAVALWRRLPLWMANRIGPRIVKNLP